MTDGSAPGTSPVRDDPLLPNARTLGKGLAMLRIFMGVVLFANGVAKLFEFRRIEAGPYVANLIDKGAARSILQSGVEGQQDRSIPGLRPVMQLMVDNWGIVGWALTATELVVGGMLIVGALTRLVALIGLGQALFLALVFATRNRWAFEQPHEYVPLIILAIVPSGRVWGLDGKLLRRHGTNVGASRVALLSLRGGQPMVAQPRSGRPFRKALVAGPAEYAAGGRHAQLSAIVDR
jgi:uncharacterized membrane protein YphA (DoxX/SURF4 family)